jgi:hypothetical protein
MGKVTGGRTLTSSATRRALPIGREFKRRSCKWPDHPIGEMTSEGGERRQNEM